MTVERIAIRNYEDATNTILNSLLTMDPAPTALYCESDELALPVIYKLCQYGHAVPQELSVIGFDDVPLAAKIGLTTLHHDPFNMGENAARKMLSVMSGKTPKPLHETTAFID